MLLFDIDGVIRDVGGSYRRALRETVDHFGGWRPRPDQIDALKGEGRWNNDWDASMELLRRRGPTPLPTFDHLVEVFSGFYFGGDPDGDPASWSGFIRDEPLLVEAAFFDRLSGAGIAWGFVSGAEPSSARFVLGHRLGLIDPPLIAMGEAPEKPDPTGLIRLAEALAGMALGPQAPAVVYLGDTVADVQTVGRARRDRPGQQLLSLAVAPPHLHAADQTQQRCLYEAVLLEAGADRLIGCTRDLEPELLLSWLDDGSPG
ncbi:TIGR01548 family HAD-type hydrolase [Synechococcus sp. CS-1324]|uniref:TIGR01548 family HAD-type hydrolase n=1 Tax=Synechococcus sp. CS-1324 TaxID=2847980 RepID=UPI000DB3D0A3|nr:TIGR01548 family HAD-type hydrolase [Synechococcus sp. CS-1324]MCT0230603.1 TIGR01548 family HAD-type hydrolase [Synechococcus sp. CS-1324]PZV05675.1 MAG: TIGR01548 family HAD-type hydrolase [Cyanobium sp.]